MYHLNMEFLSIANSIGPTALIILLQVIVITQMRLYREEVKAIRVSVQRLGEEQRRVEEELTEKIVFVQTRYVTKEDMFSQFGGWRTEINEVNRNILHLTEMVAGKENKV